MTRRGSVVPHTLTCPGKSDTLFHSCPGKSGGVRRLALKRSIPMAMTNNPMPFLRPSRSAGAYDKHLRH